MEETHQEIKGDWQMKELIKALCPPLLSSIRARFKGGQVRWDGNYTSFEEAAVNCSGYDDAGIVNSVANALRRVMDGSVNYERDGVCFSDHEIRGVCLAAVLLARSGSSDRPVVVDFGGSLASSWWQHRNAIGFPCDWRVVEQPSFVAAGRELFSGHFPGIKFFHSVDEALDDHAEVGLALFSAVLHYLPDPLRMLQAVLAKRPRYLLIERTPEISGAERICIQSVPSSIYSANYPCRIFASGAIPRMVGDAYELIGSEDSLDRCNIPGVRFRAWLFRRKDLP